MNFAIDIPIFPCYTIKALSSGSKQDLGVAQLVARYLGVVEAASSSLVTQTRKSLENIKFSGLFLYPVTQLFKAL